jgi:hypothetical protein
MKVCLSKFRALFSCLLGVSLAAVVTGAAHADIGVYVSPNDIESAEDSGITGVSTENFESRTVGAFSNFTSATINGSYSLTSGTADIQANNVFGGFEEGNQLAVNPQTGRITLTLNEPVAYFGFYFTAGDAANNIDLYDGTTLVKTFSTGTLISMLPNNPTATIKAINGSTYQTQAYYGQPSTGSNASEAYAYLHFIANAGTTFNRVVLSQITTAGAIFENDNHSIRATAPVIPGTLVAIPEPDAVGLLALGALLAARRRR